MLKKVYIIVLGLLAFSAVIAKAQEDIVIFDEDDQIGVGYYDASWGTFSGGSKLTLVGDKMPIDDTHSYAGYESGIIEWKSAPGGHWRLFIAQDGWVGMNAEGYSNLLFFVNGPGGLAGSDLPKVGLEDTDNESSPLTDLVNYLDSLDSDTLTWQRVVVPLTAFMPYENFDLYKLKTVRFNQGTGDNVWHTLWVDEIRVIYGEVDTIPPVAPTNLFAIPGDEHVYLDWDDNTETDLQGYNVYRADNSGGPYNRINPAIIIMSKYTDAAVTNDSTYYYVVKAIDSRGNESPASDEAYATPQIDTIPPAAPTNLSAVGGDFRVTLDWDDNNEVDLQGYNVYRADAITGPYTKLNTDILDVSTYYDDKVINDYTYYYTVTAVDVSNLESANSDTVSVTPTRLNDEAFLEMVQKAAFDYFWNETNPNTGVVQERMTDSTTGATGATGFGLTAICIAAERGWITRQEAAERVLTTLQFYADVVPKFHGMFSHWLDKNTGEVIPFSGKDDGADMVETSYFIAGALTCRQYFDGDDSIEVQIRTLATQLYENMEWDFMLQNDQGDTLNTLSWHWSPNYGFSGIGMRIRGYNEAMIAYIVAIGSPTHPIPASTFHDGWASSYAGPYTKYGITLEVGHPYDPLFLYQYTHCWVDFRDKRDAYTDYFQNSTNAALINRAYCVTNPSGYEGYSENLWGLTACDGPTPYFYQARGPWNHDDGTIAPTAAAGAMPFTPEYSLQTLRYMYDNYRTGLWGVYGFKDAFNLSGDPDWYDNDYIGIDEGPIVIMIENHRSGLIWNYFMQNQEIVNAMDLIGFTPTTGVEGNSISESIPKYFILLENCPNPFISETRINYQLPKNTHVTLRIYNILGQEVKTLVDKYKKAGNYTVYWNGKDNTDKEVAGGIYLYRICGEDFSRTRTMLILR